MTIETVTPTTDTRPDQSDVLSIVGGLMDHLVEAVAQRVMSKLIVQLGDTVQELASEWLEENLGDKADEWARNSLSFDDAVDDRIERWTGDNLEDMVTSAVQDLELTVQIRR